MEIIIFLGVAIVIILAIAYSKSNNQEMKSNNKQYQKKETSETNSTSDYGLMSSATIGAMLEDPNEEDSDKGWFGKGFEDEFSLDNDTGNETFGSDVADNSSGYDGGGSDSGSSDSGGYE